MTIKWYPWLNTHYESIISKYHCKKLHCSILINSPLGTGIASLISNVSRWFLCTNRTNFTSCSKCSSCSLIHSNNHPDFYIIKKNDSKKTIGVDFIKSIINKIFFTSYSKNNVKIIWITNLNHFTKSAIICLLKTIEEPPKNTFFFIRTETLSNIDLTFISRCMLWNIQTPKKQISLNWLIKKTGYSIDTCKIALKLCNDLPINSQKMLSSFLWPLKKNFFKMLSLSITNNNLLLMQPIFNLENFRVLIDWICILLIDILKYKKKIYFSITHLDQKEIIKKIAIKYSYKCIDNSIKSWIQCKNKLINIPEININLILIQQLMKWEKLLNIR